MTENSISTTLESRQVPAGNAWVWIVSGFNLFKANPVMWIVILLIYLNQLKRAHKKALYTLKFYLFFQYFHLYSLIILIYFFFIIKSLSNFYR